MIDPRTTTGSTAAAAEDTVRLLTEALGGADVRPQVEEVGTVVEIDAGVAIVTGLGHALADEAVIFASGGVGIVSDLEPGRLGVILLCPTQGLAVGDDVHRTHTVVSVPVGDALLGRVVDALGRPLDRQGAIQAAGSKPIEAEAPEILDRAMVSRPLATGIKAIDAAVPIGRGQRELIIGDRQTGKTSIAVDAMLNQVDTGVISIYCAIGQRGDAVARVIAALEAGDAMANAIVMVAGGEEAPGLGFIAPYAATTMAEHFVAHGKDVRRNCRRRGAAAR